MFCSSIILCPLHRITENIQVTEGRKYVSKSISKLQIQVATYVFELSAGNCHR